MITSSTRQALIDAEQRIGRNDPAPARGPYDHEGNGQPDKPAKDKNAFPAPGIGELAGDEIGQRFDNAKS
jgi:hypothetical protein